MAYKEKIVSLMRNSILISLKLG